MCVCVCVDTRFRRVRDKRGMSPGFLIHFFSSFKSPPNHLSYIHSHTPTHSLRGSPRQMLRKRLRARPHLPQRQGPLRARRDHHGRDGPRDQHHTHPPSHQRPKPLTCTITKGPRTGSQGTDAHHWTTFLHWADDATIRSSIT